MNDERLPAERRDHGLVFDPRSPSPLIRRGLAHLARSAAVSPSAPPLDGPTVLWFARASSWHADRGTGAVHVLTGRSLRSIDAETGDERWRFEAKGPEWLTVGASASRSPGVAAGAVVLEQRRRGAGSDQRELCALDATSGRVRWTRRIDDAISWEILDGAVLVVAAGRLRLLALEAATGRERFGFDLADSLTRSDYVRTGPGTLFAAVDGLGLETLAVDAATGATRWHLPDHPGYLWPAVHPGAVYATYPDHRLFGSGLGRDVGTLLALDSRTGRARWRFVLDGFVFADVAPVVAGDAVCLVADRTDQVDATSGAVLALDLATGRERWRVVGRRFCEVKGSGATVFARNDALRALDAATGAERWRFGDGACGSTGAWDDPIVVGGVVTTAPGSRATSSPSTRKRARSGGDSRTPDGGTRTRPASPSPTASRTSPGTAPSTPGTPPPAARRGGSGSETRRPSAAEPVADPTS